MGLSSLSLQQVAPKAGTPGVAQDPAAPPGAAQQGGSPIMMFLPFLIMIPFFFLMSRRQKKEAEARGKLKKGDKVVTQAGLIGELVESDEKVAKIKIAPGTTVQVLVSSIGPFEPAPASKAAPERDLKDLKEAKAGAEKK